MKLLLILTNKLTPQVINLGDTVTYTITFQNVGNINATDVIITDPTPSELLSFRTALRLMASRSLELNPNNGVNVGTVTQDKLLH
ncbi:DUF11 domain-containing protein [Bacillus pacificus]